MIYDPVTRQEVTIIGKYPPQDHVFNNFDGRMKGTFRFAKCRYGEHVPGFTGGFPVGHQCPIELFNLVADDGMREIQAAYDAAPQIEGEPNQ